MSENEGVQPVPTSQQILDWYNEALSIVVQFAPVYDIGEKSMAQILIEWGDWTQGAKDKIARLEQSAADFAPAWISVNESLPPVFDMLFDAPPLEDRVIAANPRYARVVWREHSTSLVWVWWDEMGKTYKKDEFTHWQPYRPDMPLLPIDKGENRNEQKV